MQGACLGVPCALQLAFVGKSFPAARASVEAIGFRKLVFFYTGESSPVLKRLKKFFPSAWARRLKAYDVVEAFSACLEACSRGPRPVAVNVTGATKPAALGALMAAGCAPDGVSVFYLEEHGGLRVLPVCSLVFPQEGFLSRSPRKRALLVHLLGRERFPRRALEQAMERNKATLSYLLGYLEREGLVSSSSVRGRKWYALTEAGRILAVKTAFQEKRQL